MDKPVILAFKEVWKSYQSGNTEIAALCNISFELRRDSSCAFIGRSGSGKTTLLSLAAGLDRPSSGSIELCGRALANLHEDTLAAIRNQHVGFVFQSFHLIPSLTVLENVMVPAELRGRRDAEHKALELLSRVGLTDRIHHYPSQLSGGEQQRTALARAYINEPDILFADEPTGNLDGDSAALVIELLFALKRERQSTLVFATHDAELAARVDQCFSLNNGKLANNKATALF